jgi:hypothetical protein
MRAIAKLIPVTVALALGGCVSVEEKRAAIEKVNAEFRGCYESILRARGHRHFAVPKAKAVDGARIALETLGFNVVSADTVTGFVRARAPAPAPLDAGEWRDAVARDRPRFRSIVAGEVGLLGWFVDFEPEGLDVVITITGVDSGTGVNLAATMRMVERKPPPSGWPRREYPPCTALEIGVEKLWRAVADAV